MNLRNGPPRCYLPATAGSFANVLPDVKRAAALLAGRGCAQLGIVGFCWGASVALQAGADATLFQAVGGVHPSLFGQDKAMAEHLRVGAQPPPCAPPACRCVVAGRALSCWPRGVRERPAVQAPGPAAHRPPCASPPHHPTLAPPRCRVTQAPVILLSAKGDPLEAVQVGLPLYWRAARLPRPSMWP